VSLRSHLVSHRATDLVQTPANGSDAYGESSVRHAAVQYHSHQHLSSRIIRTTISSSISSTGNNGICALACFTVWVVCSEVLLASFIVSVCVYHVLDSLMHDVCVGFYCLFAVYLCFFLLTFSLLSFLGEIKSILVCFESFVVIERHDDFCASWRRCSVDHVIWRFINNITIINSAVEVRRGPVQTHCLVPVK